MNVVEMTAKLRRRLPDAPETATELLQDLVTDAVAFVLSYTGRTELPAQLEGVCVKLAAVEYNRMGMEGETSHSEGSVSRSVDGLPADIRAALGPWTLARTVI